MTETILDVPFVEQKPDYCGPASLAMVMQHYGHDISQDQIGDMVGTQFFGATIGELQEAARKEGFETSVSQIDLDDLAASIDEGCPVIVAQQKSIPNKGGHYRVVVGYDSKRLIIHDPSPDAGAYLPVPNRLFMRLWQANGFDNVALVLKKSA